MLFEKILVGQGDFFELLGDVQERVGKVLFGEQIVAGFLEDFRARVVIFIERGARNP